MIPAHLLAKFPLRRGKKNQQLSLHGLDHGFLCVCCSGTLKTKSWVHWPRKKKSGQIVANSLSDVGLLFVWMSKGSAGDRAAVAGGVQVCARVQVPAPAEESVASITNPHFCVVSGSSCSFHPLVAILLPIGRLWRKRNSCAFGVFKVQTAAVLAQRPFLSVLFKSFSFLRQIVLEI